MDDRAAEEPATRPELLFSLEVSARGVPMLGLHSVFRQELGGDRRESSCLHTSYIWVLSC